MWLFDDTPNIALAKLKKYTNIWMLLTIMWGWINHTLLEYITPWLY